MRIIAGTLRSRRLKTVEGEGYRPAMGKVRESLFSMLSSRLGSFEGLDVLDLFAGSGSLAFEALSRGASRAWFVETAQNAVRCLADRAFIVKADVLKVVRRVHGAERGMGGPYGLVFLDPPYRRHFAQGALSGLAECGWLAKGAYVVMEIESGLEIDVPASLSIDTDKLFGQTRIIMMKN